MKTYSETEFNSLIRLLADDDETIFSMVNARLIELGERVVPSLWDARTSVSDETRTRIDGVLVRISAEAGEELALSEWRELTAHEEDVDLERGVATLARLNSPDLNWDTYRYMLDQMTDELAIRLSGISEANDIVEMFTQYVFHEQGFRGGDVSSYYDPDTHYIDRVLDRKCGVPIVLSAICLLLGHRLAMPIYGVGLPDQFIVKYQKDDAEVLFAPFHEGAIITREECEEFVMRQRYKFTDDMLAPVSNRHILERMLSNLRRVYLHRHERNKIKTIMHYFRLVTGEE